MPATEHAEAPSQPRAATERGPARMRTSSGLSAITDKTPVGPRGLPGAALKLKGRGRGGGGGLPTPQPAGMQPWAWPPAAGWPGGASVARDPAKPAGRAHSGQ
jgi:hypothetical protein